MVKRAVYGKWGSLSWVWRESGFMQLMLPLRHLQGHLTPSAMSSVSQSHQHLLES